MNPLVCWVAVSDISGVMIPAWPVIGPESDGPTPALTAGHHSYIQHYTLISLPHTLDYTITSLNLTYDTPPHITAAYTRLLQNMSLIYKTLTVILLQLTLDYNSILVLHTTLHPCITQGYPTL